MNILMLKLALNTTTNTDADISPMLKYTDAVPAPLGRGLCPVCV